MSSLHATVERAVNHGRLSLPPLPLITSCNLCSGWLFHRCGYYHIARLLRDAFTPMSSHQPFSNKFSCSITLMKFIRCRFDWDEQKFKIALDFNLFGCFIATPVRGWLWCAKVVMENGVLVFAAIFCPSLLFCRVTKVRGFLLFPTFIKF